MFNSKNLLVGLVAAAVSFSVGNDWMAIGQNADRYLTDGEINSFESEFQSEVDGFFRTRVNLRRNDARANELKKFRTSWAQFDSSITPFLGNWTASHGESWIDIYPTQNKSKVCVAESYYDYNMRKLVTNISIGTVADNKLLFVDAKRRKSLIIARDSVFSQSRLASREREFLAGYDIRNGKKSLYTYGFPLSLKPIQNNDFAEFGCTASLPSKIQAQTSKQKHPAESIVSDFYTWYFRNNNTNYRRMLSQKRESFTPELYKNLDRAIRISDTSRGSGMLNFDVFSNAQVESYSFQIDSVASQENSAEVYLTLQTGLGYSRRRPNPIKVLVVKNNNRWQIADFVYLRESPNIYSLLPILRDINQKKEFSEIPWGNYGTIPSVPASSSSKPVKPTDTIAKYPTNDNFKKVDRILKASKNPESLVKLRGNQADQRRKFQKEWESRNPAAAKFLGAWYTGDRYFYVFPSTAKGGTCIVTQDTNGNLTMQIGTVLNRELRYSGGKGIFWIDRTNIVASRDSGSGDLYPIYATSEVPELSESIIGDMERQKCITKLP